MNDRIGLHAAIHQVLVSVGCFALSRHSRPEIQSFGSQGLLTPRADVSGKLAKDRVADKTDLGFPTFAHAALLRMCGEVPAATKFESPKRSLLNGLKALGLAGICSLQSVPNEYLQRCQALFKLLFGSALPKARSRSPHAIKRSSEANRIHASL